MVICFLSTGGDKIKSLESQFISLQEQLLSELTANTTLTPQILLRSLMILPASLQAQYKSFVLGNLTTFKKAESVDEVYAHLSFHLTFIDYALLEHLIEKFGSKKLKDDMSSYTSSVQVFLDEATVQEMIDFNWPGKQELPPNFEKLKAVIDGNPRTYSLRELDNLRKKICRETQLSEIVFVLIGVTSGNSFVVSLMVHSVFVTAVIEAIGGLDESFCESEHIISIYLKQQYLYLSPSLEEKKVLIGPHNVACGELNLICSLHSRQLQIKSSNNYSSYCIV